MDFLLGATVIIAPGKGIPLVAASAVVKGVKKLLGRRKPHDQQNAPLYVESDKSTAGSALPDEEQLVVEKVPSKVEPVILEWSDVQCNLHVTKKGSKEKETRQLLKGGIAGVARPGRLMAILGPSGSGKTTLLNALAGHVAKSKKMSLSGSVTVNGVATAASSHKQAYVQQEDVFYSMLTVAETLNIATELRLPATMGPEERQEYTDSLVARLGLAKSMSTTVGDKKTRGLSGGEKKRLSIGCELIGSPSLIFLDEPTTGLDAFAAEKVMATLKQLASSNGHTLVCSIHQPRTSIYTMFDDLMLMSEGEQVYCGATEEVLAHFAALGFKCPAQCNPAEFLSDLISIDTSSPESDAESRSRVAKLVAAWTEKRSESTSPVATKTGLPRQASVVPSADHGVADVKWWRQIQLLAQRSWRQATRDKAANMARIMSNLSSALIFGAIFWRIKRSQSSIQDRMGLLQVAAINTAMSSLVKTLNVFPSERVIVTRERAKAGSYGTAPYLVAKLAAELPVGAVFPLIFGTLVYPFTGLNPSPARFLRFLGVITLESFTSSALGLAVGSFAPSTEAAVAIGPAVMLLFIVFGGFYVNADNVPKVLRWLPSTSLIKQGFEALCVNEFDGLEFEPNAHGGGMLTGDDVLEWLSFKRKIRGCLATQTRILIFYYWFTFSVLKSGRKPFMSMEPAEPSAVVEIIESTSDVAAVAADKVADKVVDEVDPVAAA